MERIALEKERFLKNPDIHAHNTFDPRQDAVSAVLEKVPESL
jgi:hypothetical protein